MKDYYFENVMHSRLVHGSGFKYSYSMEKLRNEYSWQFESL